MNLILKGALIGGSVVFMVLALGYFALIGFPKGFAMQGNSTQFEKVQGYEVERNMGCQNHKNGENGCGCGGEKSKTCGETCTKENCTCCKNLETPQTN